MRKCWNWQTGMTKDHVVPDREGSSPFFRRNRKALVLLKFSETKAFLLCAFQSADSLESAFLFSHKKHYLYPILSSYVILSLHIPYPTTWSVPFAPILSYIL